MLSRASQIESRTKAPPAVTSQVINAAELITQTRSWASSNFAAYEHL
jgi:hypothetical protein